MNPLDTPGYVLKKKDGPKKLDLCFMGEMRETLVDVSEAFSTYFEEKKLPVLHITKFDMIGDTEETTQVKKHLTPQLYCFKGEVLLELDVISKTPKHFFCQEKPKSIAQIC